MTEIRKNKRWLLWFLKALDIQFDAIFMIADMLLLEDPW